jgi:hypothetical protein
MRAHVIHQGAPICIDLPPYHKNQAVTLLSFNTITRDFLADVEEDDNLISPSEVPLLKNLSTDFQQD